MTKTERELDADRFVIWVSSFLRPSSFFNDAFSQCAKDRGFFRSDFFPDENQLCLGRLKRFQVPAAGDKIEKVRAIGEAYEAFCPNHRREETICKSFKAIPRKSFFRAEREPLELQVMFVLRR